METEEVATSNGVFSWTRTNAAALLQTFTANSADLKSLFMEKLRATPCTMATPWRCILYCDEITPGNVLRPDNRRKMQAFYFSFLELGPEALCHAEVWFPLAVVRSVAVKTIPGKLSAVTRMLLRSMFVGTQGLSSAGVMLDVGDSPFLFFAKLSNIVGDEAALKAVWSSKGAAGLLPCMFCKNVTTRQLSEHDASGYLHGLECSEDSLDLATTPEVWEKVDILSGSVGRLTKGKFQELEKSLGLNHEPSGVLCDDALRHHVLPIECHTYDSMHVAFANGVAHVEIDQFLQRSSPHGFGHPQLFAFLGADWIWPGYLQQKGQSIKEVFSPNRNNEFRAGATEILMLYPLFRHAAFTILVPGGVLAAEVASFIAMCGVLDALQALKHGGGSTDVLRASIRQHMMCFRTAYGCDELIPKHHFLVHIPRQVQRDGCLLDCFTHERKHQMIKSCCNWVDNTRSFEKSTLCRVLQEQLRQVQDLPWRRSFLMGRSMQCPALGRDAVAAPKLSFYGTVVSAGDIIFVGAAGVLVQACAAVDDVFCLLVVSLLRVNSVVSHAVRYRPADDLHVFDLRAKFVHQLCWSREPDGSLLVLQ